jgi:uncharacterized protein YecT (DUF1311 family)
MGPLDRRKHMTRAGVVAAALVLILGTLVATARAQDLRCPRASNDACDQWRFEEADKELMLVIESKQSELDKRSTRQDRNEQVKSYILEAQREWVRFRDAECRARVAANIISARTRAGLTSECLFSLTQRRIEEFKMY